MLLAPPVLAERRAADSVRRSDPLSAEGPVPRRSTPASRVNRRVTSSAVARATPRAGLRCRGGAAARVRADGAFVRELGKTCTPGRSAIQSCDPSDTSLDTDRDRTLVKFNPRGRVREWCSGRTEHRTGTGRWTPQSAAASGRRALQQVTDRRIRPRRKRLISDDTSIRASPRSTGTQVAQVVGEQGREARRVQHTALIAADAKGNIYVADRGNGDPGVRRRGDVPARVHDHVPYRRERRAPRSATCRIWRIGRGAEDDDARRALGGVHHARTETGAGRLRRVSGRCSSCPGRKGARVLGESGKQLKQFGWITRSPALGERLYVAELLNWRVQKLVCTRRNSNGHLSTGAIVLIDNIATVVEQRNDIFRACFSA